MPSPPDTAPAPAFYDEQQWVERLKRGDEDAWVIMIARFAGDLRRVIQYKLRTENLPADLLDDVEGETWRTVVRKMNGFVWMGEEKMRHWLLTIAHHHIQTFARIDRTYLPSIDEIEGRSLENDFALDLFLYAHQLTEPSAEESLLVIERLAELDRAMQTLSARDREIFLASLLDNADREALARRYGIEEDTVSQILWRAKGKLRAQLKARASEERARGEEEQRHG